MGSSVAGKRPGIERHDDSKRIMLRFVFCSTRDENKTKNAKKVMMMRKKAKKAKKEASHLAEHARILPSSRARSRSLSRDGPFARLGGGGTRRLWLPSRLDEPMTFV